MSNPHPITNLIDKADKTVDALEDWRGAPPVVRHRIEKLAKAIKLAEWWQQQQQIPTHRNHLSPGWTERP